MILFSSVVSVFPVVRSDLNVSLLSSLHHAGLMELETRHLLCTRELDPCPVPSKQT